MGKNQTKWENWLTGNRSECESWIRGNRTEWQAWITGNQTEFIRMLKSVEEKVKSVEEKALGYELDLNDTQVERDANQKGLELVSDILEALYGTLQRSCEKTGSEFIAQNTAHKKAFTEQRDMYNRWWWTGLVPGPRGEAELAATQEQRTCEVLADRWLDDIDRCGLLPRHANRGHYTKGACFAEAIRDAYAKGAAGHTGTDSADFDEPLANPRFEQ